MDVAGFFPHLFYTLCVYPAPYDRAKVTCVCVYSRFLKKIKAMVVRMAVTMRKFSVRMALYTRTENQG